MRNPYRDMADRINRMAPGMALRISRLELNDLPSLPDWAVMSNITMGFDRVKESVIGSAHPDLWDFHSEFDGSITVFRRVDGRPSQNGSPRDGSQMEQQANGRLPRAEPSRSSAPIRTSQDHRRE